MGGMTTSKTPRTRGTAARKTAAKKVSAPAERNERKLPPSHHAQALYRFLQTEWDAMGILPTTWCRQNNIPDPTVLRWRQGIEPDFRNLQRVAKALNRSLLDILLAAEYVTPDEVGGHEVAERTYDARQGIRQDPTLSPVAKEAALSFLDSIQMVESGMADSVMTSSGRRRVNGARR